MKSKFLKKLCVYAISASMVLPASAPVLAATTTSVVRDYSFNLLEMNYTNAVLYEGDSLQLRTTHPASKINKLPGRLTWISSNPKIVSVSSSGKITAKKTTTTGAFRPSKAFSVITLKKGNVEIAKCAVDVMPRLQFSTKTRTAKKGTTLKVFLPDAAISSSSSNSTLTPPRQLKADVLTCAAPNYSAASKHGSVSADENLTALLERIRFVLDVAEDNHVDTLILGAFGCGVFGQDAAVVACGFKRWLEQRDYRFKDVCFAVPDTENYKKFRLMISRENK